jgi:CubicO group peptidase (beta-lactamase class C family)
MHHTSGLRDYIALFDLAQVGRDQISYPSMLAMLGRQGRLHFVPGEQFSYTNSGYAVLSLVIERVSGQSLPAFTEERLFRPLGMTSTGFRVGPSIAVSNASLGYGWQADHWVQITEPSRVIGDGGLYSTVADLALWQRNMEDPRVGGPRWRS